MAFSKEQAEQVKTQLIGQLEQSDQPNKEQIISHIKDLNEQQLEEFLKKQNIQLGKQQSEKPIFESILANEIPSYKIDENAKAIAILEINPLSKGHSLIIPKQKTAIEKIPKSVLTLSQKIAKRIKTKLKPDDIKIETFSFQDYPAINVIPIYKDSQLEKKKADEKELIELQKKLQIIKRGPRQKKQKISKELPKLPKRIP